MFGLEKNPESIVEMDLQKMLKDNPSKAKELKEQAEKKVEQLKKQMREGTNKGAEFEQLTTLLNGYSALLLILTQLSNKSNTRK